MTDPSVASLVERLTRDIQQAEHEIRTIALHEWGWPPSSPRYQALLRWAGVLREAASRLAAIPPEVQANVTIAASRPELPNSHLLPDLDNTSRLAEGTRGEPSDIEVNAAIDALADKAKRTALGTSGHAYSKRAEVDRLAGLMKAALSTPPASPAATSEKQPLMTWMTTEDPVKRDAAYLRMYAEHVGNGTDLTWDPHTRARTLSDIANRMEARVSAAERPAQTCATCKWWAQRNAREKKPDRTGMCYMAEGRTDALRLVGDPDHVGLMTQATFGCTLHAPAAPRSVVASEQE